MGAVTVSAIEQADETALVSDCFIKLHGLLHHAVEYCEKYHAELVANCLLFPQALIQLL